LPKKVTIREAIIEWLRTKVGQIIGTHNIEELKEYMYYNYGILHNVESLNREFRRLRRENVLLRHGLDVVKVEAQSKENKYKVVARELTLFD